MSQTILNCVLESQTHLVFSFVDSKVLYLYFNTGSGAVVMTDKQIYLNRIKKGTICAEMDDKIMCVVRNIVLRLFQFLVDIQEIQSLVYLQQLVARQEVGGWFENGRHGLCQLLVNCFYTHGGIWLRLEHELRGKRKKRVNSSLVCDKDPVKDRFRERLKMAPSRKISGNVQAPPHDTGPPREP